MKSRGTHEDRAKHIHEVATTIRMLLNARLPDRHMKRFWKEILFDATEYPSKSCPRFVSHRAREAKGSKKCHDHVWPRKWLIEQLTVSGADIEGLLMKCAWGCTLLEVEHDLVDRNGRGFQKYVPIGIRLYDTFECRYLKDDFSDVIIDD